MSKKTADIKDINLSKQGKLKIEWAGSHMPVLQQLAKRFAEEKPLKNITLAACLHVTAETANLMLVLKAGGAKLALCASNPLSTQDDVAASLVKDFGIPTFAIKGENTKTYYDHLNAVLDMHPQITMDDGADLVSLLHSKRQKQLVEIIGSSEETTTGIIRLKAMEKDKALQIPVFAVNDSDTKHLFDNRYGTGQSTIDGILRATNMLLAGKTFVVCGYGWCGRGLANRARGMGAHVVVTEVDPIKALEAVMDGFMVMPIKTVARTGDIFVTVTGDKNVISIEHINIMKDGALVANSGHFTVEVAVADLEKAARSKRIIRPFVEEYTLKDGTKRFVLGEGRLINLVAAEGHPAEVMDMSFANQALAAEFFVKNKGKLSPQVYMISPSMDREIAQLKLNAMGVKIDTLTAEQKKYLASWKEGT
ncbi:adenosylhomocysteinase [Candidatus Microgenomates bacterium]|nr:MAG: adenosylhomocysteinase [Candidatus Microgenomates bacterium]